MNKKKRDWFIIILGSIFLFPPTIIFTIFWLIVKATAITFIVGRDSADDLLKYILKH